MAGRHAQRRPRHTRLIPRVVIAVLAALGLVVACSAAGVSLSYQSVASPDNPVALRGCVIRFDDLSSTGRSVVPRIHANGTHHCVGVTSVKVDWSGSDKGDLIVYNSKGPGTVVSLWVSPDETLAQRGISCGGSGGGTTTRIRCYDRAGKKVPSYDVARMYGSTSNLWVGWVMWMP